MSINLLLILICIAGLCMFATACFGTWVAEQKGRSQVEGMILGITLGMFGILIEALLPARRR